MIAEDRRDVTTLRSLFASALAITLAATPASTVAAAPSPSPGRVTQRGEVVRASLSIDTSALGGAADGVKERIRVRGEALLRAHDVLPARGPTDPLIAITVEPLGTEPGYRCEFAVRRGDEVIHDTAGTSLCQLCTEDELVDHLEAAIERVVPQVPASTTPAPTTPTTSRRGRDVPPPSPHPPELRALGKGGLAIAITGGVALGVGVGLAAREPPADAKEPTTGRIAGIAVASVSLGLLIAGLTMVAVDMRRGHAARDANAPTRAGRQGRKSAWRVAPSAGRASAGVVARGRF
jgi:hypothetical protein